MGKIKTAGENYRFWDSWKEKTPLEDRYVQSLEKALEWLEKQPFIANILTTYVKGSFVFREINERSDIDLVPVLRESEQLIKVREIRNKNKGMLKPVEILPISLEELRSNERESRLEFKGLPDHFTLLMSYHKLVYGESLDTTEFKVRSMEKVRDGIVAAFNKYFIPGYETGHFGFQQIVKQFSHLFYWQERLKGKDFPPSWKGIKENCDHPLLKETLYFRQHLTKDENVRAKYIEDVNTFIQNL